jgi:hypothetical protein
METPGKFISTHPLIGSHQHFPSGNVVPIHQNRVKVRRTHGWLCPFDEYESNKWFNTQRHINSQHGWGSGAPVDSRTGETREEKVRNAITQSNLPNTLTTSFDSHFGSIRSIQSDTGFGSSNTSQKWNQTSPPNTLLPPAYESNVRMPFLESQEKRVRQLGYGGGHPCKPPTGPQNDHNDSINRMTRYGEQNASSMRTGNNPNASKFQDRNELYGNKQYVNESNYIQENHWMNSLEGGHIFQATPINCQDKCLEQMWQLLALFKQG